MLKTTIALQQLSSLRAERDKTSRTHGMKEFNVRIDVYLFNVCLMSIRMGWTTTIC
jgi:hypothetical protein